MTFLHALQAEWIKTKRIASNWLSLIGGLFIPLITTIIFFYKGTTINDLGKYGWQQLFLGSWDKMAVFLLPMGMILAASLITQIENKNNTWKQVHATPHSFPTIFFSKFAVILLMTVKFFLYFNLGLILAAVIPTLFLEGTLPQATFPFWDVLKVNGKIFLACMPILAFQYLLSLNFKNFLVPIGIGFLFLIGTLIGIGYKNLFFSPFAYTLFEGMHTPVTFDPRIYALVYMSLILAVAFVLYVRRKDKG